MQEEKQSFKTYLLDTNHISKLIFGDLAVINTIKSKSDAMFLTCSIVSGELYYMMHKSKQRKDNIDTLNRFLQDIIIYPIDKETSKIYGDLKLTLLKHFGPKEKLKRIKFNLNNLGFTDNDLWIAAVALQHDLILISSDDDFNRMKDIVNMKVESWV